MVGVQGELPNNAFFVAGGGDELVGAARAAGEQLGLGVGGVGELITPPAGLARGAQQPVKGGHRGEVATRAAWRTRCGGSGPRRPVRAATRGSRAVPVRSVPAARPGAGRGAGYMVDDTRARYPPLGWFTRGNLGKIARAGGRVEGLQTPPYYRLYPWRRCVLRINKPVAGINKPVAGL